MERRSQRLQPPEPSPPGPAEVTAPGRHGRNKSRFNSAYYSTMPAAAFAAVAAGGGGVGSSSLGLRSRGHSRNPSRAAATGTLRLDAGARSAAMSRSPSSLAFATPPMMPAQPTAAAVSVWGSQRSFFALLLSIAILSLLGQLIVHGLMWGDIYRPDGRTDGSSGSVDAPSLELEVLDLFNLAPWRSGGDGIQMLAPDIIIMLTSLALIFITRIKAHGRIRWVVLGWCGRVAKEEAVDEDEEELASIGLPSSRSYPSIPFSGAHDVPAHLISSSWLWLLHSFLWVSLLFAAFLQPSLLSLPYFLAIVTMLIIHVFCPQDELVDEGAAPVVVAQPTSKMQQLVFGHGSEFQRKVLHTAAAYLMLHMSLIHIFQYGIILNHIDMSSSWRAYLGLMHVRTWSSDGWTDAHVVQYGFLLALVGCLVTLSFKRWHGERVREQTIHARMATAETYLPPILDEHEDAEGPPSSPPAPHHVAAAQRSASERHERKESGYHSRGPSHATSSATLVVPSHLRASPSFVPSQSFAASSGVRRSFFSQSNLEVRSFLVRQFRNHGLLLLVLVCFVQVMLVHDFLNIINVALLLISMSMYTDQVRYRRPLMTLLQLALVYMTLTSIVKYVFYIPALVGTPNVSSVGQRDNWLHVIGLIKHIDGFTATSDRFGSYVFLYLLDAFLPALLIGIYLQVHRSSTSASNLTVLNLFNAASAGDTSLIRRFVQKRPDLLSVRDKSNKTVLHVAAKNGHVATVRLLVQHVDVNAQDKHGNTALHYCYKHGYDVLVHLLHATRRQASSSAHVSHSPTPLGSRRPSLGSNVVDPDIPNKHGRRPREMQQSWWTKVMRRVRTIARVFELFLFANASKLTLGLLFFVSSQSINILHMLYFLCFLLFFSSDHLSRRLWSVFMAYCGLVFFALYTFSVVEPLHTLDTGAFNERTNWIRYVGLFSVYDHADQRDEIGPWWRKLSIYYTIYAIALVQQMLYHRGEELGMIEMEEKNGEKAEKAERENLDHSFSFTILSFTRSQPSGPPRYAHFWRVIIILLTYGTLLTISLVSISLFHLGYLVIVLTSLCIHMLPAHSGTILSAFWLICNFYTAGVLFSQYAYLLKDFRHWLEEHFNWERFTLYDIGFRKPHDDDDTPGQESVGSDSIALILLPPTAAFVMCVFFLRTLWQQRRAKAAMERAWGEDAAAATGGRGIMHVTGRRIMVDSSAAVASRGGLAAQGAGLSTTIDVDDSSPEPLEMTGTGPTALTTPPSSPPSQPRRASLNLTDFSMLSHKQWSRFLRRFYTFYFDALSFLAYHTTHVLALFVFLHVMFIEPETVYSLLYLLIVLVWLPLDVRNEDNTMWLPLTVWALCCIVAKYIFQFPSIVAHEDEVYEWIGLHDFNGQIVRNIGGDIAIVMMATLQRVTRKSMRKVQGLQAEQDEIERTMQEVRQAEAGIPTLESSEERPDTNTKPTFQPSPQPTRTGPSRLTEEHEMAAPMLGTPSMSTSISTSTSASGRPIRSILSASESEVDSGAKKRELHALKEEGIAMEDSPPHKDGERVRMQEREKEPTRMQIVGAVIKDLWLHFIDVLRDWFRLYGLYVCFAFLLLMSFARSNVLSLIYILVYALAWQMLGGRDAFLRSATLYYTLLLVLAISILWQYCILISLPTIWVSPHSFPWSRWDPVIQQWLLVGHFNTNLLMWDCATYLFFAWFLPHWREERRTVMREREGEMNGWCSCWTVEEENDEDESTPSGAGSNVSSGTSTPKQQQKQSLLSTEHKLHTRAEMKAVALHTKKAGNGEMYVPPKLTDHEPTIAELPESFSELKGAAPNDKVSTAPSWAPSIWPKLRFYTALVSDKIIFLIVFLIGTSHNNIFACVYLLFSCWYLLQNYLFDLQPAHFASMWRRLRRWNFFIMIVLLIYQIPWVPYLLLSDANIRWEMVIGLHKFIEPPEGSRFDKPAYMRVYTHPLQGRGAILQILIALLIEVQLLICSSDFFHTRIMPYYSSIRHMSHARRNATTQAYKEWLINKIRDMLLFREKLEANFTYIFLEASKLNVDYFLDEMVWPMPKPAGWDQRVHNLLLEDSSKQLDFEEQKSIQEGEEKEKEEKSAAGRKAVRSITSPPRPSSTSAPPIDSELRSPVSPRRDVRRAFRDSRAGPLQGSPPPDARQIPSEKETQASVTKGAELAAKPLSEAAEREVEIVKEPEAETTKWWQTVLDWLRRPLIRHIDPVFWSEYTKSADTGDLLLVSTPDSKQLSFIQVIWRFLLSNTQWIVFLLYFINLLVSANLLSLVIPVLILAYAIPERPRVGKGFWLFAMIWSSIIIIAKFVFQLYIFCVAINVGSISSINGPAINRRYIFAPSPYCSSGSASDSYSSDTLFGLSKVPGAHTYFTIILVDLLCLLSIVFHRTVLLARGLWDINEEEEIAKQERAREKERREARQREQEEEEEEDVQPSPDRPSSPRPRTSTRAEADDGLHAQVLARSSVALPTSTSSTGHGESTMSELTSGNSDLQRTLYLLQRAEDQEEEEARKARSKASGTEKHTVGLLSRARQFLQRLWRKYVPLELQYYYDDLMPTEQVHHINVRKPGHDFYIYIFFVELIASIWILCCYDMMATTNLNSVSAALSTNLFSGDMVLLLFTQIILIVLDRVCYLFHSMLCKLLLHYASLLFWMLKIFLIWPRSSQTAFTDNSYLQFFAILKLIYFIFSALQLHAGYPSLDAGASQFLTRYKGVYLVYLYRVYRALPFVFELRTMLDWICSVTSLDLWDSLKLAEIHGSLYVTQCDILYRRWYERGSVRELLEKLYIGVALFVLLLLIIFGPLLLFSTANPVSQSNPVLGAAVSLSLSGPQGEYTIVDISSYVVSPISEDYYISLRNDDLVDESDHIDAVQSVRMASWSDKTWGISPPALQRLLESLMDPRHPMNVRFSYSFNRQGPQSNKQVVSEIVMPLSEDAQAGLAKIINATLNAASNSLVHSEQLPRDRDQFATNRGGMGGSSTVVDLVKDPANSVRIPHIMPVFLRLPATADPIEIQPPSNRSDILLKLDTTTSSEGVRSRWWYAYESNDGVETSIDFITVSNRIFAGPLSNLSYSIVAMYTLILFTIGQFVRLAFGNQVQRIPYDDLPNADKLMQIVEGVHIARQKRQLAKEAILYRRLLKIYRTPALLLMLTAREDTEEERRIAQGDDGSGGGDDQPRKPAIGGEEVKSPRNRPNSPPPPSMFPYDEPDQDTPASPRMGPRRG